LETRRINFVKETAAMPWIQTRDILNLSKDFYKQMKQTYKELSEHSDMERMELLLAAIRRHVKYLEGQIGHFHLIDSDGSLHDDETSTHSPFGEGFVDFKNVLTVMKPTLENLEWWCVDFCFCPTTDKDAKLAIPYIKDIVDLI
jgi:L-ribulose-5-phosphate 3-epimerase UlaE